MSWLLGHLYRESALVSSELVPHCLVLAGSLSLQGGEAGLMSPQKGRMKPQRDNCTRVSADVPAAANGHRDRAHLPQAPHNTVTAPGTAPAREQRQQKPCQFPRTGATGLHLQCNPAGISISAVKNGKADFKEFLVFTQRWLGLEELSKRINS